MGPIGPLELVVILVILLVVFGPKRLPGLGKSLGTGMREFKDSISGDRKDEDAAEERPALDAAPAPAVTPTPTSAPATTAAVPQTAREEAPVSEPRA